jgi:hypothetical protein
VSDLELRGLWDQAQSELSKVRLFGDLVIAAFFEGEKPKDREGKRAEYVSAVVSGDAGRYRGWVGELRHAEKPLAPFHWEIEFPEVFERENPGFDAIVGNPPFMGGTHIWASLGGAYRDFLKTTHVGTGGKAVDLVAHFFRQAFMLIRENGTFTLIATNTIAQGDTRQAGLAHICAAGGRIYSAAKRVSWPGEAAVIVSVVSVAKQNREIGAILDGKRAAGINSYLIASNAEFNPRPLLANAGRSFLGHKVLGMGFVFDDNDVNSQAHSLETMRDILKRCPRSAKRIQPYIGGAEINTSPTQSPHRFAINFSDLSLSEAESWPELLALVRERVLPEREKLGGYSVAENRRERWWQYGTYAAALQTKLSRLPRFLARSRISATHALSFLPSSVLVTDGVIAFTFAIDSAFAVLQSQAHEHWARFFASSMKDDLRYTPSDCFDTFPFPEGFESDPSLEVVGKEYYDFRAALMVRNNEGLTKTYNRFHDPDERDPEILKLRELHAAMDRAVLAAYGWTNIPTHWEFLLDYEIDEEEWGDKKKPWRYRWPDEVRDEVLARLLELNAERAREEARSGSAAAKKADKKGAAKRSPKASDTEDLFS